MLFGAQSFRTVIATGNAVNIIPQRILEDSDTILAIFIKTYIYNYLYIFLQNYS